MRSSYKYLRDLFEAATAPVDPAGAGSAPCRFSRYCREEEPHGLLYKTALILETETLPKDRQLLTPSKTSPGATEHTVKPYLYTGAERADRPVLLIRFLSVKTIK